MSINIITDVDNANEKSACKYQYITPRSDQTFNELIVILNKKAHIVPITATIAIIAPNLVVLRCSFSAASTNISC